MVSGTSSSKESGDNMSENNAGDRHDSSVDDESGSGEGRSAESRNSSTAESARNSWKKKSKFELHAVTFTVYPIIHVYLHAAFIKKSKKNARETLKT